jgi:hypothetical protein
MAHKYFKGCVPQVDPQAERELGLDLQSDALETIKNFETFMESFEFQKALTAVWEFIGKMNKTPDLPGNAGYGKKNATTSRTGSGRFFLSPQSAQNLESDCTGNDAFEIGRFIPKN